MVKVSECGMSELIAVERYLVEAADSLLAFYIVLKVGKHFKAEEKQSERKTDESPKGKDQLDKKLQLINIKVKSGSPRLGRPSHRSCLKSMSVRSLKSSGFLGLKKPLVIWSITSFSTGMLL